MHVVTGGAYNGKLNWVFDHYELSTKEYTLISSYRHDLLPDDFETITTDILIINGIEGYVKTFLANEASVASQTEKIVLDFMNWEQQKDNRKLIVIGNDISKGVVPKEAFDREWRDMSGIMCQRLVQSSERFDIVWYGVNRQLK